MSDELKPCPFCGGEAYTERKWNGKSPIIKEDDYQHFAVCRSCACEGPWRKTKAGAIREWNTRPAEDAQTIEIAQLRAVLKNADNTGMELMTGNEALCKVIEFYQACGFVIIEHREDDGRISKFVSHGGVEYYPPR